MIIGVPKEIREGETRVAATPESVKKLIKKGLQVHLESGAGDAASFYEKDYIAAGAQIVNAGHALGADIVLKVNKPSPQEILQFKKGALLISFLEPYNKDGTFEKLAEVGVSAMAMELVPRTSRAQSMDALSSQAGVAGYRAVLEAAARYPRFFPMMMTSAGSSKVCRLAVLGAGVAGLQAIATARKLGAVVEAYDVRKEVREQIQSMGAKNIDLDIGEEGAGAGGYAKELSAEAKQRQQDALSERLKKFDVIISTANIPGRKSPILITEEVVKGMRPGSVIVDLAAANGGNCPLTEANKVVVKYGVCIVGTTNFPAQTPGDSSHFYAQNLVNMVSLLWVSKQSGEFVLDLNLGDDIILAALAVHQGALCHQR